ncbi:MAG: RidA family protein [Planctomycetes bacterium]|nr:RidA family protein [Planctomycetota bacterium]NUQ34814.1 RidA family protein [Planctomycetaceae bacterium]
MKHRMQIANPLNWAKPKGYNNGVILSGSRMLFVAGQVAWDEQQRIVGKGDFAAQFHQALKNVRTVVEAAGGKVEDVGRLTIYVTDMKAYGEQLRDVGAYYKEVFSYHYPAMALIKVAGLLEDDAMVEIEATAVLE